jgi:DNA primase
MKKENLSFFQALNYAASRYLNLDIEDILSKENKLDLGKIRALLSEALEFFKKELWETEEGGIALNYLKEERKLKEETILKFNLGYAPADEHKLMNFLFSLNYTPEDLKEAGLVRISEQGLIYPLFKGRVIFPIFDNLGRIIAFGGRTLDENNISPKYINSPETKLYKKGSTFYGIQFVQKAKEILVVEGYLDLILCHQAGFGNTLATLGTAITPLQVNLLKRLTSRVVLVFDSDAAGKRAAERGLELISSLGLELEFLFLPKKDAAELLSLNEGEKIFSTLLNKNRQSWQDFLLSYIEDKYNSSKDAAIEELIPFLEKFSYRGAPTYL